MATVSYSTRMANPLNFADVNLRVEEEKLSDGSTVFNVILKDAALSCSVKFPAVTEKDAWQLAETFQTAIAAHTVFTTNIRY